MIDRLDRARDIGGGGAAPLAKTAPPIIKPQEWNLQSMTDTTLPQEDKRPHSYRAEVVAERGGKWSGNGLRFATEREAKIYVANLTMRWTLVTDTRVVASRELVNARLELVDAHSFKIVHLAQQVGAT